MNADTFLEEFKRLTIENEQLKQEIKQTRITKNLEIDEVEQLYTKTSTELKELKEKYDKLQFEVKLLNDKIKFKCFDSPDYKYCKFINELSNFIDFKNTPEYEQFTDDFYKLAVPYFNNLILKETGKLNVYEMYEKEKILLNNYNKFINNHKNIISKYKTFDIMLKLIPDIHCHPYLANKIVPTT